MHHAAPHPTTLTSRFVRTLVAVAIAVTAGVATVIIPASAASATQIPDAITSVVTDKTSYGYNERIKLTFDWAVPDTAVAGDTFSLPLPDELRANTLAKFFMLAPDKSVVAEAAWDDKTVVFTLTDYVDSHDAVSGSGFLTVQWDHSFTPETSQPVVLEFFGSAIEVVIGDKPAPHVPCTDDCPPRPETPTTRGLYKHGGWTDGNYEGTRDETLNLAWGIELPGNETGYAGPIEVVDTPSAGSIIECGTIVMNTQNGLAGGTPRTAVDPTRYALECSEGRFTLQLDTIAPNEFITINYKGTITDQHSGLYNNHVSLTIAGTTSVKERIVKRTDAGGIGDGVQSVSVGNYVWLDGDNDGIQGGDEQGIGDVTLTLTGPDGYPVTNINGQLVAPIVTDPGGHYVFAQLPVLPVGQHYTVTLDEVASEVALAGLKPTIAHAGGDRALDSSTGSAESVDLVTNGAKDETLDFGFVFADLPTLPLPDENTTVPAHDGSLAYTGGGGINPLVIAAAGGLLVLGAGGMLLARRRRV